MMLGFVVVLFQLQVNLQPNTSVRSLSKQ